MWIRSFLFVGPWCLMMCVPGVSAEKKACVYERAPKSFRSPVVTGHRSQFSGNWTSCRKR